MLSRGATPVVISGRAKRILVYTVSLLIAPMPVMPFERGTREFALAITVCGAILIVSSVRVVQGEMWLKARTLMGKKLLAASLITLLLGMLLLAGAIVYLSRV